MTIVDTVRTNLRYARSGSVVQDLTKLLPQYTPEQIKRALKSTKYVANNRKRGRFDNTRKAELV